MIEMPPMWEKIHVFSFMAKGSQNTVDYIDSRQKQNALPLSLIETTSDNGVTDMMTHWISVKNELLLA